MVFHWVAGHLEVLECLPWTVFVLIIPQSNPLRQFFSALSPELQWESVHMRCLVQYSQCFLFLILFWGEETNLGSYTGQANTLQLCHTPVGLLLFPLSLEAEPTPQLALGIDGLLFAFWPLT